MILRCSAFFMHKICSCYTMFWFMHIFNLCTPSPRNPGTVFDRNSGNNSGKSLWEISRRLQQKVSVTTTIKYFIKRFQEEFLEKSQQSFLYSSSKKSIPRSFKKMKGELRKKFRDELLKSIKNFRRNFSRNCRHNS